MSAREWVDYEGYFHENPGFLDPYADQSENCVFDCFDDHDVCFCLFYLCSFYDVYVCANLYLYLYLFLCLYLCPSPYLCYRVFLYSLEIDKVEYYYDSNLNQVYDLNLNAYLLDYFFVLALIHHLPIHDLNVVHVFHEHFQYQLEVLLLKNVYVHLNYYHFYLLYYLYLFYLKNDLVNLLVQVELVLFYFLDEL